LITVHGYYCISPEKVAVVDPGEVARAPVYGRYNNGPRTLMTVLCTRYQPLRGSVCYVNRIKLIMMYIQGVTKKSFTTFKEYTNYGQDTHDV
jgi:hypothetical protein